MNIINLMNAYFNIFHIIFILKINSFTIFQPLLKREIRYTKISVISQNKTFVTINESTVKQFYDGQRVFIHFIVHKPITEFHVNFNIIKCKEHYIDCYNVVSYDICNACSKLNLLKHFSLNMETAHNEMKSCPIYGEYYYNNGSIDADNFGHQFGLSTERYWEYYWKVYIIGYADDKTRFITTSLDFYFIEYRSRRRKN